MSGEPTPAAEPAQPQTPASELQPGASPADGGATQTVEGQQPVDQQPVETEEEKTKKRERFDRRFSDLSRQVREEREARIRAEARAETLERLGGRQPHEPSQPAPAPAPLTPPDPKSFPQGEFDPRYLEALTDYRVEKKLADREQAERDRQREEAAQTSIQEGRNRLDNTIEAARAQVAGEGGEYFQNAERVLELAFVPPHQGGLPRHMVDCITGAENPVHIAEVLGRQPERMKAIRALGVVEAAREIGKLDAIIGQNLKRAATPASPPAPVAAPTPSPAPIPTVSPSGAAPSFNPEKASFAEFEQHFARVRGNGV